MGVLVVGSVAYDDLETPEGKRTDLLGGAATHFAAAASFFTKVSMVGVVGSDFNPEHIAFFKSRGIDLSGLESIPDGRTFRWTGHYLNDLNQAETIGTELGVFADFDPKLSKAHRETPYLFLANIHPQLQLNVLEQMEKPELVAMDTMNLWINSAREELHRVIEKVDIVFVNDAEAKMLTGEKNVVLAAHKIMSWGPAHVAIKRGEHGALLFSGQEIFIAPALPLPRIVDPTGAGDTFAGGFMGYVARMQSHSRDVLRKAAICGSLMASFQVEDFGLDRLRSLSTEDITTRFAIFGSLSRFDTTKIGF